MQLCAMSSRKRAVLAAGLFIDKAEIEALELQSKRKIQKQTDFGMSSCSGATRQPFIIGTRGTGDDRARTMQPAFWQQQNATRRRPVLPGLRATISYAGSIRNSADGKRKTIRDPF